jgi:hypothetical protein
MQIFKSGEPIDLSAHMLSTYQSLRVVLVVIALIFPWLLWIGGYYVSRQRVELQHSISAYYHANEMTRTELALRASARRDGLDRKDVPIISGLGALRNWFVGALFAISALLAVYKGFRPAEDLALNLAAVFAALVALFPSQWVDDPKPSILHGTFAVLFFLCIAYVCIFCASATLPLVRDAGRRAHFRRFYKLVGWTMVASPVLAAVLNMFLARGAAYIFFLEAVGVYAFAAYWLVKTIEIRETKADRKAASGELQLAPGTGPADAVRELPVTQVAPAH